MRMINSGIHGDAQIYKQSVSRPSSRIHSEGGEDTDFGEPEADH